MPSDQVTRAEFERLERAVRMLCVVPIDGRTTITRDDILAILSPPPEPAAEKPLGREWEKACYIERNMHGYSVWSPSRKWGLVTDGLKCSEWRLAAAQEIGSTLNAEPAKRALALAPPPPDWKGPPPQPAAESPERGIDIEAEAFSIVYPLPPGNPTDNARIGIIALCRRYGEQEYERGKREGASALVSKVSALINNPPPGLGPLGLLDHVQKCLLDVQSSAPSPPPTHREKGDEEDPVAGELRRATEWNHTGNDRTCELCDVLYRGANHIDSLRAQLKDTETKGKP